MQVEQNIDIKSTEITYIHESIWNTDTVYFNLDWKYLYFDQDNYKIRGDYPFEN